MKELPPDSARGSPAEKEGGLPGPEDRLARTLTPAPQGSPPAETRMAMAAATHQVEKERSLEKEGSPAAHQEEKEGSLPGAANQLARAARRRATAAPLNRPQPR